jgi:DNA-binding NarL/FixJ family response regulator
MLTKEEILNHLKRSPAKQEVLQLLVNRKSVKQIVDIRHKSESTVRHQVESLHKLFDTHDNAETVIRALQIGAAKLPEEGE